MSVMLLQAALAGHSVFSCGFQQCFEFMDPGFKGCKKMLKVLITMDENGGSKCSARVEYLPLAVCSGFVHLKLHHNVTFTALMPILYK